MCSQWKTVLVNDEKLRDQTNVANAFNKIFITFTEKLNIQHTEKGGAISFLKYSFPVIYPSIEIILIMEAEVKSIVHPKNEKNPQVMMK